MELEQVGARRRSEHRAGAIRSRAPTFAVIVLSVTCVCTRQVCAEAPARDANPQAQAAELASMPSARAGMFLPYTVAASMGETPAAMIGLGGYDTARRSAVMGLLGDVHVWGPFDLRLGIDYTPNAAEGVGRAEPQVGARVRILSQTHQGLDLAAVVNYRLDRYTQDEGMVQALIAVGRRVDQIGVFASFGYGQDPEGDDREAEASVAALYTIGSAAQIGLESHGRFNLWSEDARRAQRHDPDAEIVVGPIVQYDLGPCLVLATAGMSARLAKEDSRVGAIALAGVSRAY